MLKTRAPPGPWCLTTLCKPEIRRCPSSGFTAIHPLMTAEQSSVIFSLWQWDWSLFRGVKWLRLVSVRIQSDVMTLSDRKDLGEWRGEGISTTGQHVRTTMNLIICYETGILRPPQLARWKHSPRKPRVFRCQLLKPFCTLQTVTSLQVVLLKEITNSIGV